MNKKLRAKSKVVIAVIAVIAVGAIAFLSNGGAFKGNLKFALRNNYSVSTTNVNFLNTLHGSTSFSQVRVTNNTLRPLNFTWRQLPGDPVFNITENRLFTVQANSSQDIHLSFSPVQNAMRTYTTRAIFSDGTSNTTLELSGTGVASYSVLPYDVQFPRTAVGATSRSSFAVRNNTGSLLHFWLNNPRSRAFRLAGNRNFTVQPGEYYNATFNFTPRVGITIDELEENIVCLDNLDNTEVCSDVMFHAPGIAR